MSDFYSGMMSRNWAFISPNDQARVRAAKVLLAGCGLGSNVAVLAAEMGFTHFIVADYDVVEVSNLNRQVFDRRHIGKNKALCLKSILEEKSKVVEVEAYPVAINTKNAKEFVSKADIVVNTVDFDETMYAINEVAQSQNKLTAFPLNVGFGGVMLAFTQESKTLQEMVGEEPFKNDMEFLLRLLQGLENFNLPDYIMRNLSSLKEAVTIQGYSLPQLGSASFVSATLVVTAIVRFISGIEIRLAPEPHAFDPYCFNAPKRMDDQYDNC